MKKMKKMVSALFFVGMMCVGMNTYATNIVPPEAPQEAAATEKPATKETSAGAIKTVPKKEDVYYVRITQPSLKDEILQTFDSQMNIMGEASVGTEIKIIVYYGEEVASYLSEEVEKDEYALKTVGATETFSQLIDLKEGQNNIVIQYQYKDKGAKGMITIKINRIPEEKKDIIKSHIDPKAIADKIVTPTSAEKSGPTQTNAPVSK